AQAPADGQRAAAPAQRHAAGNQPETAGPSQAVQFEHAIVRMRQRAQRRRQRQEAHAQQYQGEYRSGQAVPGAAVQKRAPDERVAGADQFHDFDFLAAVFDVQSDGVADDEYDRGRQQQADDPGGALEDGEDGLQATQPGLIQL